MKKYIVGNWGKSLFVSNIFGVLATGLSKLLVLKLNASEYGNASAVFVFSDFIIIPLLMGTISAWYLRKEELSTYQYLRHALINCAFSILFSFFILQEGTICLIIVSPLLFGFVLTGVLLGRVMFKKNNNTLNASVISILVFVLIADVFSEHKYENCVSDELIINAHPEQIWKNVVAFDSIQQPAEYWLFKAGMPAPSATTVDGYCLGADRKCIFSNGYVFDEKIVAYVPNENLTFDIIHQPRDPEIMGHIDIVRGQFLLKDNGNGTTTLVGNSWYKLYVFPTWYFDWWAEDLTRNVHFRVMEHIKYLSEKK